MKLWETFRFGEGESPITNGLWYSRGKNECLAHIRDSERCAGDDWIEDAVVPYPGQEWSLQLIEIGVPNFDTIRRCLLHTGFVQKTHESYTVTCKDGRIVDMTPTGD